MGLLPKSYSFRNQKKMDSSTITSGPSFENMLLRVIQIKGFNSKRMVLFTMTLSSLNNYIQYSFWNWYEAMTKRPKYLAAQSWTIYQYLVKQKHNL